MNITTESPSTYEIRSIVESFYLSDKSKYDMLSLLMQLKSSLEFNATIDWKKVCKNLGKVYRDDRPYYYRHDFTPDPVPSEMIGEKDIFVFASNNEGRHGGGSAKDAMDHHGAIYGQAHGMQGNSYAIVTKDLRIGERSIPLEEIERHIDELLDIAAERKDLTFWVTKIGCGRAGYTIKDIAPLFANKVIPDNVVLPIEFVLPRFYKEYFYNDASKTFYKIISDKKAHAVCIADGHESIQTISANSIIGRLEDASCVVCEREDYIEASKQVINKLYN